MRFTAFVACALVAFDCTRFANGFINPSLFGQDFLWVWYLIAIFWMANGFLVLFRGFK